MKKLFTFLILFIYGVVSIRGQQNLPFFTDFTTNSFTLVNGTQTNKWHHGTATGNTGASLYVSSNNGTSNTYINNSESTVHAYVDLNIPAGSTFLTLEFDWRCVGENGYDRMFVYLAPTSFTPVAGSQIATGNGITQVGGQFVLKNNWQQFTDSTVDVSAFAGSTMRLIFQWRNDFTAGNNPPIAIDNVKVFFPTCIIPGNQRVTGSTVNSATVAWDAPTPAPAMGYEYYLSPTGAPPTPATVGTPTMNTTATFTGLALYTSYKWWVRSVCSATDKSSWVEGAEILLGQIGTGNDTMGNLPINSCWEYNYSQMIYTPSEVASAVGNGRVITKIKYFVSSVAPLPARYAEWKIFMANSNKNEFTSNTDWIPHAGFQEVFSGNIPAHAAGQWMEITLDTPFIWDGGSNLVIAVDENTPDYSCTTQWGSYSTNNVSRGIQYQSDNTNPDPASPPSATSRPTSLPRLRMEALPLPACSLAAPTNVVAQNITDNSARLTWQPVQADAYVLQWRQVTTPASPWITVNPNPTFSSYILTGLAEQTRYEYRVAHICNGTQGAFNAPVRFTTLPLVYCGSNSTVNPSDEHITNVTIDPAGFPVLPTLSVNSTASAYTDNYLDATKRIRLVKGSTGNTIAVSKGFGQNPVNVAISAWIDFNRDGAFDANEQIFNSAPNQATPVTGTFDVPAVVYTGNHPTRMRVIARKTNSPNACGTYPDGETEDYAVEFVDMIPCDNSAPQNVAINNITSNSATVNWTADPGGAEYVIRYRELGQTAWLAAFPAASLANMLNLTNLTPATSYELSIAAICGGVEGTPVIKTFDTPCSDEPVTNLQVTQIGTTTAEVSWDPINTATYVLQYKSLSAAAWQSINLSATNYTLTNLTPNVTYQVRVATVCSGVTNPFSTPEVFTTFPTCEMPPVGLTISDITMTEAFIEWTPTPGVSAYVLEWRRVGSNAGWNVINLNVNEYLLTGLTEDTRYEVRIAHVCNGGRQEYTAVYEFMTPVLKYCEMAPTTVGDDYITNVTVNAVGYQEMTNNSTASGYTSFVAVPDAFVKLIRGSQNNKITVNKAWRGNAARNAGVTVWIDFNRDGIFSNHERILISPANGQDVVEGTFSVPADSFVTGTDGKFTVMRVAMSKGKSPEICTDFQSGEIEDYRVIISTIDQFETVDKEVVNIYPVPAKEVLHITLVENGTKYTIYNSTGQVVHVGEIFNNKIELNNIISGVYVIDIDSEQYGRVIKRFIKH